MVSNEGPDTGLSEDFSAHLACLFDILADGQAAVSTPSLIRRWQLSDYSVSFALIDAFQKYSSYDNQLGFDQFSDAVRHCLASCEPYITAGSPDQLPPAANAGSDSGYRTFDSSSRSLEPAQSAMPKRLGPPLRVYSDSGILDRQFDGRPRPLRPPDYETYMNNSLDCGISGTGGSGSAGSSGRRSRLKPPVPPRTAASSNGGNAAGSSPNSPASLPTELLLAGVGASSADPAALDGPDADDYETLIGHSVARGPPPPPPRPSSMHPAQQKQQQQQRQPLPPPPPLPSVETSQERQRQRARSPMKRLMQAFTRPLSRSQSFRISRPSATAASPSNQPQQQQPLAKFASFVENPDRFSGSYHARGALLRERLRCVRQAYECVEACRQSLVAQIADLQSQLAGCPGGCGGEDAVNGETDGRSARRPVGVMGEDDAASSALATTAAAGRLLADQEARIQRLEREKSQLLRTLLQAQALG